MRQHRIIRQEQKERMVTMKKFISLLLCAFLLTAVFIAPAPDVWEEERDCAFSLDEIDPQMSLLDALEQYPEICDIFYIDKITPEQAELLRADGITTINGDEVSASILYSLNARKVNS